MRHRSSHRRARRARRAFTLLELMMVVAILALLAVMVLPNLLAAGDQSRYSATRADLRSLATALERYAFEHHRYPAAKELAELHPVLVPGYLKELPIEDRWGHRLLYRVDPQGSTYTLRSPGKDGAFESTPRVPTAPELGDDDGADDDRPADYDADIVIVDGVFLEPPAEPDDEG